MSDYNVDMPGMTGQKLNNYSERKSPSETVYKKNDKFKFEVWYHSDDLSRTNYRRVDFSKASEKDFYRKVNKLLGES